MIVVERFCLLTRSKVERQRSKKAKERRSVVDSVVIRIPKEIRCDDDDVVDDDDGLVFLYT